MNKIVLREMTESEYLYWRELSVEDYGNELFTAGQYEEQAAMDKAREEFDAVLPQGLNTPDNYIYMAMNTSADNEKVGHIWYKTVGNDKALICDLEVYQEYRGMGFSKMILTGLEDIVRAQNVNMIYLHILEQNIIALDLYENMSYERFNFEDIAEENSIYMKKNI